MSSYSSNPFLVGSASLNWPIVSANAGSEMTLTVTGAAVGDALIIGPPTTLEPGLIIAWYAVTSANTVTIRLRNVTGTQIDPAAATWKAVVIKR